MFHFVKCFLWMKQSSWTTRALLEEVNFTSNSTLLRAESSIWLNCCSNGSLSSKYLLCTWTKQIMNNVCTTSTGSQIMLHPFSEAGPQRLGILGCQTFSSVEPCTKINRAQFVCAEKVRVIDFPKMPLVMNRAAPFLESFDLNCLQINRHSSN